MVLFTGHSLSVDSWAIGVLLVELITGHTPFGAAGDSYKVVDGKCHISKLPNADSRVMAALANTKVRHSLHIIS